MWNNSNKDYLEFANEIRSKKDSKHRILLGEEKWAVERALKRQKFIFLNGRRAMFSEI